MSEGRTFTLDDFRGLSVAGAGELIRHEPVEHAVIYSRAGKALYYRRSWPGEPFKVTILVGKTGLLRGNVFVHNHPEIESFSAKDIWILLRHGAHEVRAYGPARSFRIVAARSTRRFGSADAEVGWRELDSAYDRMVWSASDRFTRLVRSGRLTDEDAWSAHTHAVVRRMALRYAFLYEEV